MNRHVKSVLVLLLFVLLLVSIYIVPVKKIDDSKPTMTKTGMTNEADSYSVKIRNVSMGK